MDFKSELHKKIDVKSLYVCITVEPVQCDF